MQERVKWSNLKRVAAFAGAVAGNAGGFLHPAGASAGADQDRLRHGDDRAAGRQRQVGAARHEDLGRGHQQEGRADRPAGEARLLRRPEQSFDGAGHLRQAARHRQSRRHRQRLCHQHDRPGDARGHAARQGVSRPVRHRRQQRVQIQQVLRDDPDGAGPQARLHQTVLRRGRRAEPEAGEHLADGGGRRVWAQRLRRRAPERQGGRTEDRLRQDLSRRRPPTSPRSSVRSRLPIPTSLYSAPIRSTRWA